jgi:LuxR family maltose regulon positive regulatory protein
MAFLKPQLLITKNHLPQLPLNLVARPRLSRKLNEAMRHRVALLSAPAGYGKTTLLTETLRESKKPVGWVSLDTSDNNPGSFWTYVIGALQNVEPGMCQPILNALQSPDPPPTNWLLAALINSISSHEDDFALILDDYHAIESQTIHEGVSFVVEHLPPQVHLVIASRVDPPLPLARWRARGEIAEIRANDLGFSIEEAAAFFKKIAGITLNEQDLATLESRTEGWIAGLKMAAFSLTGKKDISGSIKAFSGSNRYILDYFADEVLNRQPPHVRQFLVETSILERLSGPLCDAVTERSDSQSMLVQLESANLFISPLDDERRWYRYHQLFAAILRSLLAKSASELVRELHRRASTWYEKEGLTEEAIDHSLLGSDAERVVGLLENAAPFMLGQGQAAKLLDYLARIPEPLIKRSPWLCVGFAWAAIMANKQDVLLPMLSRAIESFSESPDRLSPGSRANVQRIKGHTLSIQSLIAQSKDDFPRAIQLSEEANRELPGDDIGNLLARAVNSLNLAACYQKTGDIAKAIPFLEELIAAGRETGFSYAALAAQGSLAEIEMQLSRLDRVAEICRKVIEQRTPWGGAYPLPGAALAYIVHGHLDYERNNLDGAVTHLTKGIELGEISAHLEPVLKGYLYMAELAQAQGNQESAIENIRRAENVGPWVVVPPEFHQIPAWKARLALRRSDSTAASDWARQQEISLPLSQLPGYQKEYDYLTLVRLKIATGECRGLPVYLDEFIRNAEHQGRSAAVIEALVLKALALGCIGESAEAVITLDRALTLAEYVRVFVNEGSPMAELLRNCASGSMHADYASKLLGMMIFQSQGQSGGRAKTPGLIEALSERELEVLKLISLGKSNKEIAFELFLAVGTVKKHTSNIFGKLGVESRTQAITRARELGII